MTPWNRQQRGIGANGWGRSFLLAAMLCVAGLMLGCSDDATPKKSDAVQGKTPVVCPAGTHGRGAKETAVLSPDYREGLVANLTAEAEKLAPDGAKKAGGTKETPAAERDAKVAAAPGNPSGADRRAPGNPTAGAPGAGKPSSAALEAVAAKGFPLPDCRQLLLVLAPGMDSTSGTVRRFERQGPDAPWREVGTAASCLLGRKGLAIGRGLVPIPGQPVRRQGDGCTPAGFFTIPQSFGYADVQAAQAAGVHLPYKALTDRTACVTDPGSPVFGRIVGPQDRPAGGFAHQERMVRKDRANVWGVVIGHNWDHPDPEAGACLFLDVRPVGATATGGSIGCSEETAASLAAWLDPAAQPVLVVLPQQLYQQGKQGWRLP